MLKLFNIHFNLKEWYAFNSTEIQFFLIAKSFVTKFNNAPKIGLSLISAREGLTVAPATRVGERTPPYHCASWPIHLFHSLCQVVQIKNQPWDLGDQPRRKRICTVKEHFNLPFPFSVLRHG